MVDGISTSRPVTAPSPTTQPSTSTPAPGAPTQAPPSTPRASIGGDNRSLTSGRTSTQQLPAAGQAQPTPAAVAKQMVDKMVAKAAEFKQAGDAFKEAVNKLQEAKDNLAAGKGTQADVDQATAAAQAAKDKVMGMVPEMQELAKQIESNHEAATQLRQRMGQ